MKLSVTTVGSLVQPAGGRPGLPEILSARVRQRLALDLEQELQSVIHAEHSVDDDPEARRDALERAVRRVWGATL